MINSTVLIGEPLNFKDKLKVYPPRVKDVVGNPNFNVNYSILTITQEDIKDEIRKKHPDCLEFPTPFEYLIIHCQYTDGLMEIVKNAFQLFCKTDIEILFDEQKIIIGNAEEIVQSITDVSQIKFLTEEDFFDFQNLIRESCGDKSVPPPLPDDPDEDPRVRRIKEKARERDRIKARQGSKDGISLNTCLVAICCMGIGLTPLNIGEMSYASIGAIMKMMQDKEKYDIDIRSLLAGADSKKIKPKYWIGNEN